MEIHLREGATPVVATVPRKVPFALQSAAKEELDAMVAKGLLVPVTRPTDWCSQFLVVLKPKGGVRLVVDYKPLNRFVKRPVHPFPAAASAVDALPSARRSLSLAWRRSTGSASGYRATEWPRRRRSCARSRTSLYQPT